MDVLHRWTRAIALGAVVVVSACSRTASPADGPMDGPDAQTPISAPLAKVAGPTVGANAESLRSSAPTLPAATLDPAVGATAATEASQGTTIPAEASGGGGPGPDQPIEASASLEPGAVAGRIPGTPSASAEAPAATAAVAAAPGTGDGAATARPADWQPEDPATHPLSIQRLRSQAYPGSDLVVVQDLPAGSNYRRQVVSYESEGHTIYGLLTVPSGEQPASGWPIILFNHGYIPPAQYRTTERYVAYQDAFARAGYITLKSDYRGHGSSEGEATSGRSSPDYTVDVLNAMGSVVRLAESDPGRVGMWGHSMGGSVTLRAMVISNQIKAGVIWAGVVASYTDMFNRLGSAPSANPNPNPNATPNRRGWRSDLIERFGTPAENPAAWDAVSPNAFLAEISGPLQLHHGSNDHSVPLAYSERLQEQMEAAGRPSELFVYQGDDHNLAGNLRTALQRSVAFFDQHVKGGG